MHIQLKNSLIRNLRIEDATSLARHANNRKIWINLRDVFPYPYAEQDARNFIVSVHSQKIQTNFAIEINGEAAGCIGYGVKTDVERVCAEIGYWLGETYWNRGVMTEALIAVTSYAIQNHQLTRVFALPFSWNTASARVLEKAGYVLEARLQRGAIKDGQIIDQLQYAFIVPD